jgi:hypothetical protein
LLGLMGEMRIRRQEEMLNTKIQQGRKEWLSIFSYSFSSTLTGVYCSLLIQPKVEVAYIPAIHAFVEHNNHGFTENTVFGILLSSRKI